MVANSDPTAQKKIKKAVALKYDKGKHPAPHIVGKGRGQIAEKILAVAAANGIPVKEDTDLTEVLEKLDIGDEIPLELYAMVAEIFAYLYRTNTEKKKQRTESPQTTTP